VSRLSSRRRGPRAARARPGSGCLQGRRGCYRGGRSGAWPRPRRRAASAPSGCGSGDPVAEQIAQVPQLARRDVRLRQQVGTEQVRERVRVDRVGLHAGGGARLRAQRMREMQLVAGLLEPVGQSLPAVGRLEHGRSSSTVTMRGSFPRRARKRSGCTKEQFARSARRRRSCPPTWTSSVTKLYRRLHSSR
jgi:hypothetical protein